jgi:excisionase family DNA binding protein
MNKKEKKTSSLVSAPEIASRLGIGVSTARKMIKSGQWGSPVSLTPLGARRHWRVKRFEFESYLNNITTKQEVVDFEAT